MDMLKAFLKDDSGAVTVDWVVLTAAIVGLGVVVLTSVGGGTADAADTVSTHLATTTIVTVW